MKHERMPKAAAYDKARKEFYQRRHLEDIERRIAKEEALATGAYFGKTALEVGMQLEDEAWRNWMEWARGQIQVQQQRAASQMVSPTEEGNDEQNTGELATSEEMVEVSDTLKRGARARQKALV
jgi:small subunit ribosomal protein S23